MAKKKHEAAEDRLESVEEVLSKSERFIEDNQRIITIVIGAIVVVVLAIMGFQRFYLKPMEQDARNEMYMAEIYFNQDSLSKALNGDGIYLGFLDIIDDYGMTKAANLANYYAGICYLRLGDFEMAIEHLEDFSSDDEVVAPMAEGALGDANLELGNTEAAARHYRKAALMRENQFTAALFLMKAGQTYELAGAYKEALDAYETLKEEYPLSREARSIDKYIERVRTRMDQS